MIAAASAPTMPETAGTKLVSAEIEALDRRLGLRLPRVLRLSRRSSSYGRAVLLAEQVAERRTQLKALPLASRQEWEHEMEALRERQALSCWEVIMFASLRPEVSGGPDFQRWQIATKLIRSPELTRVELLAAAVEFARQGRLVAAIYALSRSICEKKSKRSEAVHAVCLVISAINDDLLRRKATVDPESCRSYVQFQESCVDLLQQLLHGSQVDQGLLEDKLERLQTLLGQQGAHGHALALKWMKRQLKFVHGDGWLVEVGCSREIIEGQHSTAQLASFARQSGRIFAGIDMDPENIKALRHEFGDQGRHWVLGKGEEVLGHWSTPIAGLYLDAYDFWHRSHSEIREMVYRRAYGAEINDAACHRMHLEATRLGSRHLLRGGVLAIDDTWMESGQWVGKGALAVPWLLEQGWPMVEAANRAVVFLKPPLDDGSLSEVTLNT